MKIYIVLAVFLASILCVRADEDDYVDCWDYCTGTGSAECDARINMTTCKGVACKITRVVGTDIVTRECVVENDEDGVYAGNCWAGNYFGLQLVTCQYAGNMSNQNFEEVTCYNYCEGNDDRTGFCDSRKTVTTCTGVVCRRTWWKGSDVYASSCVTEEEVIGLGHEDCYSAVFEGNDVRTCQCREDECNTEQLDGALNGATKVRFFNLGLICTLAISILAKQIA